MEEYFYKSLFDKSFGNPASRAEEAFRRLHEGTAYYEDKGAEMEAFVNGYARIPIRILSNRKLNDMATKNQIEYVRMIAIQRAWEMGQNARIKDDKLLESRLN